MPILAALGIAALAGCGGKADREAVPKEMTFEGITLRVGVVASPDAVEAIKLLVPLNAQRGEWEANRKAHIEVLSKPITPESVANASLDVMVFPGQELGGLIDHGMLAPIPEDVVAPPPPPAYLDEEGPATAPPGDPFAINDILPSYRETVARYGDELMALPLGGSALVLVYRRDVFEREENRDAAAESGVTLGPPATYQALDSLARFFQGRDWDGDGAVESGIALPLGDGPEGVGIAIYLARAAAIGLHPDYFAFLFNDDTMAPEIDVPPFVDALNALEDLADSGPEGMSGFDAEAARAAFREGKVALLIDRAEMASRWTGSEGPSTVGVAPLPGSMRVYDPDRKTYQNLDHPNRPTYLPNGGGWLAGLSASAEGAERGGARLPPLSLRAGNHRPFAGRSRCPDAADPHRPARRRLA